MSAINKYNGGNRFFNIDENKNKKEGSDNMIGGSFGGGNISRTMSAKPDSIKEASIFSASPSIKSDASKFGENMDDLIRLAGGEDPLAINNPVVIKLFADYRNNKH